MIAIAAATILLATNIKPSPARFLALGDSYAIGERVAVADRWPNQLAQALRAKGMSIGEPEIVAKTGWTTDRLLSGIDAAKPLGPYSIVTLLIGVNDQYWDRDRDRYRAGFVELLQRAIGYAGGNAKRVVVISIPDWGVTPFAVDHDRAKIAAQIDRFNAVAREEAMFAGARYVDVTPISRHAATDPTASRPRRTASQREDVRAMGHGHFAAGGGGVAGPLITMAPIVVFAVGIP
jgi:lysophospholipase L1-like esterase